MPLYQPGPAGSGFVNFESGAGFVNMETGAAAPFFNLASSPRVVPHRAAMEMGFQWPWEDDVVQTGVGNGDDGSAATDEDGGADGLSIAAEVRAYLDTIFSGTADVLDSLNPDDEQGEAAEVVVNVKGNGSSDAAKPPNYLLWGGIGAAVLVGLYMATKK